MYDYTVHYEIYLKDGQVAKGKIVNIRGCDGEAHARLALEYRLLKKHMANLERVAILSVEEMPYEAPSGDGDIEVERLMNMFGMKK